MGLWTYSIACVTSSVAFLSQTFHDHLFSVYFGKTVCLTRSHLQSFLSLLLLYCLLVPFIALSSTNNGNSYYLIVAFLCDRHFLNSLYDLTYPIVTTELFPPYFTDEGTEHIEVEWFAWINKQKTGNGSKSMKSVNVPNTIFSLTKSIHYCVIFTYASQDITPVLSYKMPLTNHNQSDQSFNGFGDISG